MIGPHRLRQKLERGEPAFGPIINFDSPWLVDVAAIAGFDLVLLDAEHGPLSPAGVEAMMRAAEAGGLSAAVRVPANLPHEILRFLDVGAVAVQVPHLESAAAAAAAAAAVRYPPDGQRGLAPTTRAAGYGIDVRVPDYVTAANREVLLMAMVESVRGVERIDEIAATPGVDVIAIGPGDLAQSMGLAGDRTAPAVQEAVDRIIAGAKACGRWVSLPAADAASARRCLQRGADIVLVSPAALFVQAGRELLAGARR